MTTSWTAKVHAKHTPCDADYRADGLSSQRIGLDSHGGAGHHQRGLFHVAGQPTVVVQMRKEPVRVGVHIDLAAVMKRVAITGHARSLR